MTDPINKVNKLHTFEPAEQDKVLCRHCGLSMYATVHEIGTAGLPANPPVPKHQPMEYDPVEAPAHYCKHKTTTAQLVVDWQLDFYLGNAVKYIERHQDKAGLQDLKKAKKYLEMKIELEETGSLKETIKHG